MRVLPPVTITARNGGILMDYCHGNIAEIKDKVITATLPRGVRGGGSNKIPLFFAITAILPRGLYINIYKAVTLPGHESPAMHQPVAVSRYILDQAVDERDWRQIRDELRQKWGQTVKDVQDGRAKAQ